MIFVLDCAWTTGAAIAAIAAAPTTPAATAVFRKLRLFVTVQVSFPNMESTVDTERNGFALAFLFHTSSLSRLPAPAEREVH